MADDDLNSSSHAFITNTLQTGLSSPTLMSVDPICLVFLCLCNVGAAKSFHKETFRFLVVSILDIYFCRKIVAYPGRGEWR